MYLPIYVVFQALIGYIFSAMVVHMFVPLIDIYLGFRNLFCQEKYKEEEGDDPLAIMPALKLFEQFGEAIPQLAIALAFYSKNYLMLSPEELLFGIATMSLSFGSILIGVVMGLRIVCKNFTNFDFNFDDVDWPGLQRNAASFLRCYETSSSIECCVIHTDLLIGEMLKSKKK